MTAEHYTISSRNDAPLTATRFPAAGPARGVVLIVPAMATPAIHYTALAEWFAAQDFVVHTFDYQGYGASARTPLTEVEADILTWAEDAAVMLKHVAEAEAGLPVWWVGHSLGGHLLPFTDHGVLDRATFLCSGSGYWGHADNRNRVLAPMLWYAIAPAVVRTCGYFPGRRMNILGDLPAPVMRQWGTWCKHPNYMFGSHPEFAHRYAAVRTPITSVSFTDDETMSAAATRTLEGWYSGTELRSRRYAPAELGVKAVTHMGIISRRNAPVWPVVFADQVAA